MQKSLLVCILCAVGFAPAPLPRLERRGGDPQMLDLARLQGTWEEVRYILGPDEKPGTTRCVIAGARMSFYYPNGKIISDWTITLDVRARPKGMYCKVRGPTGGVSHDSVYELSGNTLKLCYAHGNRSGVRLTDFQPAPDRAIMVLVRTRP